MASLGNELVRMEGSRLFDRWLASQQASLVFTTYQAGKVYFIGSNEAGGLSIFERTFDRCMGLCHHGNALWMAARHQLWRFSNTLEPGQKHRDYDGHYVPLVGYTTGDVDIHDIGVMENGRPLFVVTLFNCLATLGDDYSFIPVWKPPFISRLVAEDRCHLNGLAMEHGLPRYVSMVGNSDVVEGWREQRRSGGLIMDVQNNQVVCDGLSMPHSPRVYRNRLWLLNAGSGEFGFVDARSGRFQPVAFCPGFLRGLAFLGDYAVVGLSKIRNTRSFSDLVLGERLEKNGLEARCGLQVIHLETGASSHTWRIEGFIEELYDVVVLPGVRRPMALGFRNDEIYFHIRVGEMFPLGSQMA